MSNAIGKMIGSLTHRFSVKNAANDEVEITVNLDFTGASDQDIRSWLVGNRTIAFQRPLRLLSAAEIKKLDGSTIAASDCGKKQTSKREKFVASINALKSMNVDTTALITEWNTNNPDDKIE